MKLLKSIITTSHKYSRISIDKNRKRVYIKSTRTYIRKIFGGYMNIEEKKKALQTALKDIEKAYGKGAVMKLGEASNIQVESSKTGSLGLDVALGIGGIPKGRVIEVYGHESSGKTTLALHMVAEVQKAGGIAGFIDAEHALDPVYAKGIGVDIDNLYISQPDNGEQGLAIAEAMVASGAVDIVIVDSVAALVPKAEIQGQMSDQQMGLQARLMSKGLRKLTGIMSKFNCTVVFINQLREKIATTYGGGGETTTGGRALKFYASVRLEVKKVDNIKKGDTQVGNRVKVKVAKNKVAPPFKVVEFDILYGTGISRIGEIMDMAVARDIIEKSGAWYSYNGSKLGQGKENARIYLTENSDLLAEIEQKVREYKEDPNVVKKKVNKKEKTGLASTTLDEDEDSGIDLDNEDDEISDDLEFGLDDEIINDTGDDLDELIGYTLDEDKEE